MAHRMAFGRLHHGEGADDIGVDIGTRVLEAVAHACLCREMHDDVGCAGVDGGIHRRLILEHGLSRGEPRLLQQHLVAALFQADVVIVGHAV